MSETVKLIIEIPKEDYEFTKGAETARVFPSEYYVKLILNGIPLEDIKAEINNLDFGFVDEEYKAGISYAVMKFNQILDNIGKESEG